MCSGFTVVFYFYLSVLFFGLRRAACRVLVPQPGIEPALPAVEEQSLNHWAARGFPAVFFFFFF